MTGEKILLTPCSQCGGEIVIITYRDQLTHPTEERVSHGICSSCMKVVIIPGVKLSEIPHKISQGETND